MEINTIIYTVGDSLVGRCALQSRRIRLIVLMMEAVSTSETSVNFCQTT
jgi:hypothetical protein